jgi:hypothetical protein
VDNQQSLLDYDNDPQHWESTVEAEQEGGGFRITNDEEATWAMRKLLLYRNDQAAVVKIADAERQRIDSWVERRTAIANRRIDFFENILRQYASEQRTAEDRKTIDTPYGVIKSRQAAAKFVIHDKNEFLAWADTHPDVTLYETVRKPLLSALNERATVEVTPTLGPVCVYEGEIVPGVFVEPASVNYRIEVIK